jgi:hypothetical protein
MCRLTNGLRVQSGFCRCVLPYLYGKEESIMLKYIAKMPCRFCGNPFEIGDTIPTDLIEPSRIHALTREGVIAQIEIDDKPSEDEAPAEAAAEPEKVTSEEKPVGRKKGAK